MSIEEKELDDDLMLAAIRGHIRRQKMLRLTKAGDEMQVWCDQCQRYEKIDRKTAYQAKMAKVCPMCFRPIQGTTSKGICTSFHVADEDDGRQFGWRVCYDLQDGKITKRSAVQVGYWVGNAEYVRGIILTMNGYIGSWDRWNWRKVEKGWYGPKYLMCFYDLMELADEERDADYVIWDMMVCNKKTYYQYIASDLELKSNQIKFVSEGLYNRTELEYIKQFNLSNAKQVAKYRKYMATYYCDMVDRGWNVTHLDYLYRNKIRMSDYVDYYDGCKAIGRKPDKPKDFRHWHDQVIDAVEIKKNEIISESIQQRSAQLKAYTKGEIQIQPIHSYEEITKVGKILHNCIRTYAERYAKGTCDLYYISDAGTIKVAIEVREGKIVQARGDRNGDMPKEYSKVFNEWQANL